MQFPEQYADMALLLDKDPELDFFNNVAHLQLHRRQRALQRLTRVSLPPLVLNFDVGLLHQASFLALAVKSIVCLVTLAKRNHALCK